jgi:fibronectin type 3 domain-containing protein
MKSLKMSSHRGLCLGKIALLLACVPWVAAPLSAVQPVSLVWDPSPDAGVGNYRVHYGTASGVYGQTTNAGLATNLTVQGLTEGNTYFFAVTAVGTNQLESDFSNEVIYNVPLPSNTTPTITAIPNQSINEDGNSPTIAFTVGDAQSPAGALTVTGSSSNPALLPNASIVFGGSDASRTLTLTPAANAFGTAQITVTVSDGALSTNRSFTLTVNSVNDAPTLATLGNLTVAQNAGQQVVSLSGIGTGAPNESQTLAVAASSSNPTLIPAPQVAYTSPGGSGSLSFTPASGQTGSAQITVTVTDNGGTANGGINTVQRTFAVSVVASPNATPTLDNISNVSVVQAEGEPGLSLGVLGAGATLWAVAPLGTAQTSTVNLTGITSGGESAQSLTVTASSSNPTLVPNPTVAYTSPSSTGSLTLNPVAGLTGSAVITVTVRDNGGGADSVQKSFTVNVSGPANTAPVIANVASQTIDEDVPSGPIALSVSDAQTAADSLTVRAACRNTEVIADSGLSLSGSGSSRSLRIQPQPNRYGKALITLSVTDGGGAIALKSFWVTVNPVNDAPTLDAIASLQLTGDQLETVALGGIGVGPLDGIQGLTVQASSSNPSIIANPEVVYYSPNTSAELQLAPVAGASGSATVTVTVQDDGGTANGGQNVISRTFTVTTAPVVAAAQLPAQGVQTVRSAALAAPRPVLGIQAEDGWVTLSWEGSLGSYVLERRAGFGAESAWQRVVTAPVLRGTTIEVRLRPQHPVEIFRLAAP